MNSWLVSLSLLAQADAGQNASAAVQVQSVWDFIVKGGPMMVPIGLASLLALAIVIERAFSLRRRKVIPPGFLAGLEEKLSNGAEDRDQALAYCRENGTPLANVLAAGIRRLGDPIERVEKHIEQAGQREVLSLRKYLRALALIASITPLMGLLGTIFGMIRAFQTVATAAEALGRTELLAKGIYEAMITTAAGLLVAIPVLIGYHWLAAKVQRLVLEMDRMVVDFVEEHAKPKWRATRPVSVLEAAVKPTDRKPIEAPAESAAAAAAS